MKNIFKINYSNIPNHVKVAAVSWTCKIITASIQVISIRLLITNLGAEQYAGYAILTSLISWFSLFEFGLSPSLQNFISESRASNRDFNSYLQATVPILLLILLIAIFFVSIISAPLQIFLFKKVSDDLLSEPLYLVGVVGFLYSITALCGIAYKVYYAEQKGHLANIYPAIGSILSFILLLIFGHFGVLKDNLKFALLIMIMPTTCIAAYAFYDVFLKNKKINVFKFDSHLAKIILSRAYRFAGFSFFSTIVLQVDYIVMSRVIDAHGITQYNLIAKVYFLIFFIYSTMLFALWPTCTELMEKRKITKVYKLVTINMLFGWLVVIAGTVMFLFTNELIAKVLTGGEFSSLPKLTITLFGAYYCIRVWSDMFAMLLQSINKMKVFWVYAPFMCFISVVGQYFFGKMWGINGILIGLILAFLATSTWILPVTLKKVVNRYYLK